MFVVPQGSNLLLQTHTMAKDFPDSLFLAEALHIGQPWPWAQTRIGNSSAKKKKKKNLVI